MKHLADTAPATVFLHPGEIAICEEPTRVITILGSCVSVVMFNPALKLGAICHGTLPKCRAAEECTSVCVEAFKYMDCALHYMLDNFHHRGIENRDIVVKIFGGADTLMSKSSSTIGSRNIRTALDILGREKLKISAEDVGDAFGRKIIFFSHTGKVLLKRLNNGKVPEGLYG